MALRACQLNPQDDAGAPEAGVGTDHTQVPRADAGLCQDIPEGTAAQIKPSLYSALYGACRNLPSCLLFQTQPFVGLRCALHTSQARLGGGICRKSLDGTHYDATMTAEQLRMC